MRKTKLCPECGEKIIGRIDKKYCSDECRNAHNNKFKSRSNRKMNKINAILKKNRGILETLVRRRVKRISKEELLIIGFNFHYVTHFEYGHNGTYDYYCYEYGYYQTKDMGYRLLGQRRSYKI